MEMQTSWYIEPGQTLESTKIDQRDHALHITGRAWQKVRQHLDRNRIIQDTLDKERAHKEALKKGSEEMTQNWSNSVENIRKRKEEERETRLVQKKDDRMQKYFEMLGKKKILQEKYVQNARKDLYTSKGFPKRISNALVFSEILHEREKQIELEKLLQEHEKDVEIKYNEKVNEEGKRIDLRRLKEIEKITQEKIEMRDLYIKESKANSEARKLEKQKKIDEEIVDNENSTKESEKIKKIEKEKIMRHRNEMEQNLHRAVKEKRDIEEQTELQEKQTDQIREIYVEAKDRILCLRKKREKELQQAVQERSQLVAKPVVEAARVRKEAEQRFLQKGKKDHDKQEQINRKLKAANEKRLLEERINERQEFLKREEKRKFEEMAMPAWEMINRFKTEEVRKQYDLDKKQKEWDKTLQYRKELFSQMAKNEESRKQARHEEELYCKKLKMDIEEADKMFFDYAEEVYEYAQRKGRTTAPIERIVQEYKHHNDLPTNYLKKCENYGSRLYKQK